MVTNFKLSGSEMARLKTLVSDEITLITQGRDIIRKLWNICDRGLTPEDLINIARSYRDATVVTDPFFMQSVNQRRITIRKPF